jgi:hypothetical protein
MNTPEQVISRSQWSRGLRHELSSLEGWDRDFEFHSRMDVYVRLFCVYVVLCVCSGIVTG